MIGGDGGGLGCANPPYVLRKNENLIDLVNLKAAEHDWIFHP
jgi:hypothetical protein